MESPLATEKYRPNPRSTRLNRLACGESLDVLIIGGGITGAPLYHQLCQAGYRTGLIDKSDFSSGTSQASGMLIWGGLLYLKSLDLFTVRKLCRARNDLMRDFSGEITPLTFRYLNAEFPGQNPAFLWLGLHLYWLLGDFALRRPRADRNALAYQEGMLRESDSRFVINSIRAFDSENTIPVNYCRLIAGGFDPHRRLWSLTLRDERTGREYPATSRFIVNCAGVWTDEVNRLLQIESPYRHVFSKGVYLAFPRSDEETEAAIYPMRGADDVLTAVPWGPVTMWGPTETAVNDLEAGFAPDRDDVRFLLTHATRCLPRKWAAEDIVSLRCGVRPLAVPRNYAKTVYPLELSRRHCVAENWERQILSVYGGKFTSSRMLAEQIHAKLQRRFSARHAPPLPFCKTPALTTVLELDHPCVTPEWARDAEFCVTLEDYLRRRTPISQWVPRMGLGKSGVHRDSLLPIAEVFASSPEQAARDLDAYGRKVQTDYDPLLTA